MIKIKEKSDHERSFLEFLRETHKDIKENPIDMVQLRVVKDFDLWIDNMPKKEVFCWADAYAKNESLEYAQSLVLFSRKYLNTDEI